MDAIFILALVAFLHSQVPPGSAPPKKLHEYKLLNIRNGTSESALSIEGPHQL